MAECLMLSAMKLDANKPSSSREKQAEKYSQSTNMYIFSCCRGKKGCNLLEIPMRILLFSLVVL